MKGRLSRNPTELPDDIFFPKYEKLCTLMDDLEKVLYLESPNSNEYSFYVNFYPIDRASISEDYIFPEENERFGFELRGEIEVLDFRFFDLLKHHVNIELFTSLKFLKLNISDKIYPNFSHSLINKELSKFVIEESTINYLPSNLFDNLNLLDGVHISDCKFNEIENNTLSLRNMKMFHRILFYENIVADGSVLTIELPDKNTMDQRAKYFSDPKSVGIQNNLPKVIIKYDRSIQSMS